MPPEAKESTATQHDDKNGTSPKPDLELIADYSKSKVTILHVLCMYMWSGWMSFYVYFPPLIPILWIYCPWLLAAVVCFIIFSATYTHREKHQPKFLITFCGWLMKMSIEYLQARLYFEDSEALRKTEGKAIIAFEPHDILPVSVVLFTEYFKFFRPLNIRGCFTSAIFMVPGMKHFFAWSGSTDADKSTIRRLINEGKTPALCPGGVQEVTYMTTPDAKEITLHMRNRLGLIKLAAEYGLFVVPIFSFNQRKTYDYWVPQWPWLQKLGRKMGFLPILIRGYLGIPFGIPKPVPVTMVVGKPIPVRKMSKEEIEKNPAELHAVNDLLMKAMEKLFEDHKNKFNMEDNILIIK